MRKGGRRRGRFFQAVSEKRMVQRMDTTNRMLSISVAVSAFSSTVDCFFSITFYFSLIASLCGFCSPFVERDPVGRDAKSEPFCSFPTVRRLPVPACRRAGKDFQPIALRKNVRFFPCGLPFPGCEACVLIERRAASVSNGATACRRPLLSRIGSQDTLIEE